MLKPKIRPEIQPYVDALDDQALDDLVRIVRFLCFEPYPQESKVAGEQSFEKDRIYRSYEDKVSGIVILYRVSYDKLLIGYVLVRGD